MNNNLHIKAVNDSNIKPHLKAEIVEKLMKCKDDKPKKAPKKPLEFVEAEGDTE